MKKVLWLFFFFAMTSVFADGNKVFVYNENGKRDPFDPLVSSKGTVLTYDSDVTSATDLILQGVVIEANGNNLAIINGKIVKVGDQVGPYTVESIAKDHVNFTKGQEQMTVKLKKAGG